MRGRRLVVSIDTTKALREEEECLSDAPRSEAPLFSSSSIASLTTNM